MTAEDAAGIRIASEHRIGLAATVSDPTGALSEKLRMLAAEVAGRFTRVSVVMTRDTASTVADLVSAFATVEIVEPDVWHAGIHRKRSVELALQGNDDWILYADLDHLLRWIERAPIEFDSCVASAVPCDVLIIGRSQHPFELSPERLRRTEGVVNDLFRLETGHDWDVMMSARLPSRNAAKAIVRHGVEASLATDVEGR